jgi:hypothetical protein
MINGEKFMEQNSQAYKYELYQQIQDEYGKLVFTYTCHLKFANRIQKKNVRVKWLQIILSAITTGGFLGVIISDKQVLAWTGGICATILLALSTYLKDINLSEIRDRHVQTSNSLWKLREEYVSVLTDFEYLPVETIISKRDKLLNSTAEIYDSAPLTDNKSYLEAQDALQNKEEQYFTQDELNVMLPIHLRK